MNEMEKKLSAFLSLCVPGAGQIYNGEFISGIVWLVITALGYGLIVPGLLLHAMCITRAYSSG